MSNPIVEALTAALTEAEGKSNKYGAGPHYLYAWECLHIAIEGAIPAVESLVAENARLTAEAPEAITEASDAELRVIAGALWHDRRGWRERALAAEEENVRLKEALHTIDYQYASRLCSSEPLTGADYRRFGRDITNIAVRALKGDD